MSIVVSSRRAVAVAAPARVAQIESALKRYPKQYSVRIQALAQSHFALADLALSFPGLLFALATGSDEPVRRGGEAIVSGASLREAAACLGLPMWLRALSPEAFVFRLGKLPEGRLFALRIANHLPRAPKQAARWLDCVANAACWADENVAVWVARELTRERREPDVSCLRLVCLWAWFSQRPETMAGALSARRWSPLMKYVSAAAEARDWLSDVEVTCVLGSHKVQDAWMTPQTVGEFIFAPLTTAADLISEARQMKNCIRSYGGYLRRDICRLWVVKHNGKSVANVEVAAGCGSRYLHIDQTEGRGKSDLAPELDLAIHQWFRSHPLREAPAKRDYRADAPDRAAWLAAWRPYWLAKRRLPSWLPMSPSYSALNGLRA